MYVNKEKPGMSSIGTMNNNSLNINTPTKSSRHKSYNCGEEIELKDMQGTSMRESSHLAVHHFARHVKPQHQHSDTLHSSSTLSSSASTTSGENSKDLCVDEKSADSFTDKPVVSHSKKTLSHRVHATSMEILKANADDDDLDLSSLRDLMDSMRQAAKEIREITKPLVKSKKKELGLRPRDQKRHKKKHGHRRNSGHHQQIQAEIHVISEVVGLGVPATSSDPPQISIPERTEEGEQHPPATPSPPTAFLHVENEELSHTWPRRRGRSVSRQRSVSDNAPKPGTSSEENSPMVSPPVHSLWLHPHRAQSASIKGQAPSVEKLAVHQSSKHHPAQPAMSHRSTSSQHRSRGRTQKGSPVPRAPPPSPHTPFSPPPHILVNQHDAFHQDNQQGEAQQPGPEDEDVTIDMV